MTVLDTMKAATPLVRRVTLCLDGALQAEYDALLGQLPDAALKDKDSLAASNVRQLTEAMEAVRERMLASEVTFSFGALPWFRKMTLQAEHPPREGNLIDRGSGHNVETYVPALIRESCRSVQGQDGKAVTEVPAGTWAHLLGEPASGKETGLDLPAIPAALNFPQIDVLFGAANAANENATTVPPSARSLLASQDSGASSKSPGPGTSPRNGSKGGSRHKPRSTTTTKTAGSPTP